MFPEYNSELPTPRILFSWTGTVFQLVLKKPLFWCLLILHIMLEVVDSAGWYDIADVEPAVLSGPTSLLIFFAVMLVMEVCFLAVYVQVCRKLLHFDPLRLLVEQHLRPYWSPGNIQHGFPLLLSL